MQKFSITYRVDMEQKQPLYPIKIEKIFKNLTALQQYKRTQLKRSYWHIPQMDCPMEEKWIRQALLSLNGVYELQFNLLKRELEIVYSSDKEQYILQKLSEIGMAPQQEVVAQSQIQKRSFPYFLVIALVFAGASEVCHFLNYPAWIASVLAVIAIVMSGLNTYKKGWIALKNRQLNINALMSVAVTGALILGQWAEAAMVMVLFSWAEWIERQSLERARQAISSLMELTPEKALVKQEDQSWLSVKVDSIKQGQWIQVRPGERIPLDGKVIEGISTVDQSPITGESIPVEKQVGATVFAGTLNQTGVLIYQVTATTRDTLLNRIIQSVEEAQAQRAPTQGFIDKFATIYTPTIFLLAMIVALVPPLFGGEWGNWIYKALVLVITACPCALVISIPITITSALANAARQGILIKGGAYLELARKIKWLALDKTGTITIGKLALQEAVVLNQPAQRILEIAVSLATYSTHPVSQAIVQAYPHLSKKEVEEYQEMIGKGVVGKIDQTVYQLVNFKTLKEETTFSISTEFSTEIEYKQQQGNTVVLFADKQQVLAYFCVADNVKPSSQVALIKLNNMGIQTVMLTGDSQGVAQHVAKNLVLTAVYAQLLPQDKLAKITQLSQQGVTAMVGDGINDAPALARADMGIAMGAIGTDSALETADVVLMDDQLTKLPILIRLSQRTHRILVQNIVLALGVKLLFLLLTFWGITNMWLAVFADVGTSLLVILNGLRILYIKETKLIMNNRKKITFG